MIDLVGIAATGAVECPFCQSGFKIHHGFGSYGCFVRSIPDQFEHLLHMRDVLLAEFD